MAGWLRRRPTRCTCRSATCSATDRKMLRSRSGDAVKLIELLDEAVERAAAAVAEKNPDLDADDAGRGRRRSIGIGARQVRRPVDRPRSRTTSSTGTGCSSFDGNTAPYLQYAHARIRSIFRRAGVDRESPCDAATIALGVAQERALAQRLLAFDARAATTRSTSYSPHKLCSYLFDLPRTSPRSTSTVPVLKADEPLRTSRLALCDLTARTLAHGLGLLGIEAPEQM